MNNSKGEGEKTAITQTHWGSSICHYAMKHWQRRRFSILSAAAENILEDEHFQFKSLPRHKALLVAFLLKIIPRQAESKRQALAETA